MSLEYEIPADIGAERAILGAIFLNGERIHEATEYLPESKSFYLQANAIIYEAMLQLASAGESIDIVVIADRLGKSQQLEQIGGQEYLQSLLDSNFSYITSVQKLSQIIRENYILRQLIKIANDISIKSYERNDSKLLLDEAEQRIFDLSITGQDKGFVVFKDALKEAFSRIIERSKNPADVFGISSGFKALDNMTTGFKDSELILVAARPSMGKTAFALNIGQHAATMENKVVAIFSLEMDAQSLVERMISATSRVDSKKIRTGKIDDEELGFITSVSDNLGKARIFIDENSAVTIPEMRSKLRKLKLRQKALDMVIIDYIQLMNATGKENRQQEIAYISRSLKGIAREMNCPVIALSQLSRASEKRGKNMRPMLSDIRDSGAIEQDADIVMFIHREEYYQKEDTPEHLRNVAEVIVAKHRNGEVGTVYLGWNPSSTRFENIDISQKLHEAAGLYDEDE